MSWTDERVETLKRMWAEGQSASQIAKELGGVTRNAVIGKVHRLGLSNRVAAGEEPMEAPEPPAAVPEPEAPRPAAPRAEAPAPETPPAPEPEPVEDPVAAERMAAPSNVSPIRKPMIVTGPLAPQPAANEISAETLASAREVEKRARRLTLMELTERTCKWPIGDPATQDFYFCGHVAQPGKPYCEAHVSVAFQPMSSRRDRRR